MIILKQKWRFVILEKHVNQETGCMEGSHFLLQYVIFQHTVILQRKFSTRYTKWNGFTLLFVFIDLSFTRKF